jgi:hypothetical protein
MPTNPYKRAIAGLALTNASQHPVEKILYVGLTILDAYDSSPDTSDPNFYRVSLARLEPYIKGAFYEEVRGRLAYAAQQLGV